MIKSKLNFFIWISSSLTTSLIFQQEYIDITEGEFQYEFAEPVVILEILKNKLINKATNFKDLDSYFIVEVKPAKNVSHDITLLFLLKFSKTILAELAILYCIVWRIVDRQWKSINEIKGRRWTSTFSFAPYCNNTWGSSTTATVRRWRWNSIKEPTKKTSTTSSGY